MTPHTIIWDFDHSKQPHYAVKPYHCVSSVSALPGLLTQL